MKVTMMTLVIIAKVIVHIFNIGDKNISAGYLFLEHNCFGNLCVIR
jgi:hypothetical protein